MDKDFNNIYALFNDAGTIVRIGFTLNHVTSHLAPNLSHTLWSALFESDDPKERKKLLENAGFKIKIGEFVAIKE